MQYKTNATWSCVGSENITTKYWYHVKLPKTLLHCCIPELSVYGVFNTFVFRVYAKIRLIWIF